MSADNLDNKIKVLLQTNPVVVDLSSKGLTAEHVKMIVDHQKHKSTIRELYLDDNKIGADGYNALAELVRESKVLVKLTAQNNFELDANKRIIYQSSDEPNHVVNAVANLKKALLNNPNILVANMDSLKNNKLLPAVNDTFNYLGTILDEKCLENYGKAEECIANIENLSNDVEHHMEIKNRMPAISSVIKDRLELARFSTKGLDKFKENLAKIQEQATEKGVFIEIPKELQLKPGVGVDNQVTALANNPEKSNAVSG